MTKEIFLAPKYSKVANAVFQKDGGRYCDIVLKLYDEYECNENSPHQLNQV